MSGGSENWVERLALQEGEVFEDLEPADQIDVICDAFEREWQSGRGELVERFLEHAPVDAEKLSRLQQELIPLEFEFRTDAGEKLSFRHYAERIPEQALFIARFLCDEQQQEHLDPPLKRLGKYWLLEIVGRGSFGTVYRAYDRALDGFVAIKVPASSLGDAESVRRFQREARNAGRLQHPGIVRIYSVEQDESGQPYIVCDFVEGETLDEFIQRKKIANPRTAASLVAQVAESLAHAHQAGVIHRDLKPSNVMLEARKIGDSTQDGTPDDSLRPKVLDFGLARRQDGDASMSIHGAVVGTPAYMSPEQARGDADVDQRVDIYSLGAILYELLFGQRCFAGETFSAVILQVVSQEPKLPRVQAASVPQDLVTICLKCLSKAPSDRYSTAEELADDLRRWLRNEEIRARPLPPIEKAYRWLRKNVALTSGLAAGLLMVLAVAYLIYRGQSNEISVLMTELESASSQSLPEAVEKLRGQRRWSTVKRLIRQRLDEPGLPGNVRLRWRIVLLPSSPIRLDELVEDIDLLDPDELTYLAQQLRQYDFAETDTLRKLADDAWRNGRRLLPALVLLAELAPDWAGWQAYGEQIVTALAGDERRHEKWAAALKPVAESLYPASQAVFARADAQRKSLAEVVTKLFEEDPEKLIAFLRVVRRGPEASVLVRALASDEALAMIKAELDLPPRYFPWHELDEAERNQDLERYVIEWVNLALCYAANSEEQDVVLYLRNLLECDADPRPRTYFIRRARFFLTPEQLFGLNFWQPGQGPRKDDLLFCAILAVGLMDPDEIQTDTRNLVCENLLSIYRLHPDSGVHGAADYTLRAWGRDQELAELKLDPALRGLSSDRDWFHTSFGMSMVVIPAGKYDVWLNDQLRTIETRFCVAIAANEFTERDFERLTNGATNGTLRPKTFLHLQVSMSGQDEYEVERPSFVDVCRAMDKAEQVQGGGCFSERRNRLIADCSVRANGFRLPMGDEWWIACSSGSMSPLFFGTKHTDAESFLPSSRLEAYGPVGKYLPNRLGMFDLYGNVFDASLTEWVPWSESQPKEKATIQQDRVILKSTDQMTLHGGCFYTDPWHMSTDMTAPFFLGSQQRNETGLRTVCTIKPQERQ